MTVPYEKVCIHGAFHRLNYRVWCSSSGAGYRDDIPHYFKIYMVLMNANLAGTPVQYLAVRRFGADMCTLPFRVDALWVLRRVHLVCWLKAFNVLLSLTDKYHVSSCTSQTLGQIYPEGFQSPKYLNVSHQ